MSFAPSSRNVLELFVRDHDAKTIRNIFIRTLQQSNSAALDNLLTAMEAAGFDFSSTRALFALPKSLHCVRCHETYDPRKNTKTSCTTEHVSPEMWKQKTSRGSYMYHYSCCGEEVPGDDEEPKWDSVSLENTPRTERRLITAPTMSALVRSQKFAISGTETPTGVGKRVIPEVTS
jgi:hypothetical protein